MFVPPATVTTTTVDLAPALTVWLLCCSAHVCIIYTTSQAHSALYARFLVQWLVGLPLPLAPTLVVVTTGHHQAAQVLVAIIIAWRMGVNGNLVMARFSTAGPAH